MFALTVELLTDRYAATTFNDRDSAEWPPHPARLFSALVAAWADDDDPSADGRDALVWLEAQAPPDICCDPIGDVARREVVTHFVPVNDAGSLSRDVGPSTYVDLADAAGLLASVVGKADKQSTRIRTGAQRLVAKARSSIEKAAAAGGPASESVVSAAREVLPQERNRQPRTFPTVRPRTSTLAFLWPEAEPDESTFHAVSAIAARVGRLGHSSSLVAVQATRSVDVSPTFTPDPDGELSLRVLRAGLLDALDRQFAVHRGTEPRTLPNAVARYREGPRRIPEKRPLLGGDWIVLRLPASTASTGRQPRIRLTRTLDVARAVRGALLVHGSQPAPDFLTGHSGDRDPADVGIGESAISTVTRQSHLAIVPLPDVASVHSTGTIQAVALVLPVDCSDEDRRGLIDAIGAWGASGRRLTISSVSGPPVALDLDGPVVDPVQGGPGSGRPTRDGATSRRSFWCHRSRTWTSVTPIALDRFPGDLRARDSTEADRAVAAAEQTIARSCALAGLPEPVEVEVSTVGLLAAVPPVGSSPVTHRGDRFPGYKAGGSGQRRVTVHARITFEKSVSGPVLIGAGRYLGYGLFFPMREATSEVGR